MSKIGNKEVKYFKDLEKSDKAILKFKATKSFYKGVRKYVAKKVMLIN